MEQFTRECLEVDKDASGEQSQGQGLFVGTSMEQIYERAARLVKRTLDVEGAVVMDVSHVDVLENISAECSTSITVHNDDPQIGTVNKMLNPDEHAKLQDFFNKAPDGKICEGVLPAGLRPFIPGQIQYALGNASAVLFLVTALTVSVQLYRYSILTSDRLRFCAPTVPVRERRHL